MEKQGTLVMKFGGTSVGSTAAMQMVVDILQSEKLRWENTIVVISAMSGVTNLLLDSADQAIDGNMAGIYQAANVIREKHLGVVNDLIPLGPQRTQVFQQIDPLVNDFIRICQAINVLGEATPRVLDSLASMGERLSVRVLAAVVNANKLSAQYVDAMDLILTDSNFQAAHPDLGKTEVRTRAALTPMLAEGVIPIVTGFLGANEAGVITTLGRGGSDYSAAILGAVLPAEDVWIWTDVDGVMTADPRIAPEAATIPELSYREVAELAYFGAKVLHPKTIRPVIEAGIGLRVCNTFNPAHPGTRIVARRDVNTSDHTDVIKAVTAIKGHKMVTVEGRGMLGVPGVAARAFSTVASTGTSVILITQASSEQSICFAIPGSAADQVVSALEKTFAQELGQGDIDRIWHSGDLVIITIVGAGMQYTPGVAGMVFGALGDCRVNIIAIAQGSTEAAISLVVDPAEADQAIKAIHHLILKTSDNLLTPQ